LTRAWRCRTVPRTAMHSFTWYPSPA